MNLVLTLLYTRRPLNRNEIRSAVVQYTHAVSDEAFSRMFERDKDELRALGIPVVTEGGDAFFGVDPGYRIHQRDYALPGISFEPDEIAALGLAARTWAQASLAGPAAEAVRKLAAAGVEPDDGVLVGIEPRLRTIEPSFDSIRDAVVTRTPVTFDYRRPDRTSTTRRLRPWGMAMWHGRWYVTGHDLDRDAQRVFRLSRIVGPVTPEGASGEYSVPEDHDALAAITASTAVPDSDLTATVRVRVGTALGLRRRASTTTSESDQWDVLTLDNIDLDGLAHDICGHGADVVAVAPLELVTVVEGLLDHVIAVQGGAA